MSPAQVLERSYVLIKQQLLDGLHAPGQRLEAARLADEIHVSITPVRDVLNRLTGEGLVRALAGDGFYVPLMTEQDLRDLLHWNAQLLGCALRHKARYAGEHEVPSENEAGHAARTASLFRNIMEQAGNGECVRAIASANDRLHAIRLGEVRVLADATAELDGLERAWSGQEHSSLRDRLRTYHRRRHSHAARLLKRAATPNRDQ